MNNNYQGRSASKSSSHSGRRSNGSNSRRNNFNRGSSRPSSSRSSQSRGRSFGGRSRGSRGGSRSGRGRRQKDNGLHPDMYVLPAQPVEDISIYVEDKKYTDFDLDEKLLKNLQHCKYTHPTKIQDAALPHALQGKDVLAIAATGSGKTAAFLIPMVNKVMNDRSQKCLVILPTRELAQQTEMELNKLVYGTHIKSAVVIGGVSSFKQKKALNQRPNFVIATPGRLKDLYQQRALNLSTFNNVVLDEVDRMLDMGFIHDIRFIVSKLRKERQSMFVSATMDKNAEEISRELLQDPIKVQTQKQSPHANVDQNVVRVNGGKRKIEVLHELLIQDDFEKVLVFAKTKRGADRLSKDLYEKGHKADSIHGDKSQSKRTRVIDRYRKSQIKILVATDVVARGLDIKDITHVINFDEPNNYEDYIHRIGRTGRIGKTGVALTFVE